MSDTNTGGPAFPLHSETRPAIDTEWCGMTLRDYFAAKAMQGLLSADAECTLPADIVARDAYYLADQMLKAREQ